MSLAKQLSPAPPPLDLVWRGHVVDPGAGIDGPWQIGVRQGVVVASGDDLGGWPRRRTVDLPSGTFGCPGFVDIHAHVYAGVTSWGIYPDGPCLASGVTTVVDAGSPGWTMLEGFRRLIHDRSQVRALCFLHISGIGLVNAWVGECEDLSHLHPRTVGEVASENRDLVVGIKVRQGQAQVNGHGVEPLRRALAAADLARMPVMCHIAAGIPLDEVLGLLRNGDIVTHCFQGRGGPGENLTDASGALLPSATAARARGVVMDVGHGGGSFRWSVAEAALAAGFLPDVISTDLHAYNAHGPLYDMATTLTKFLYLGLPVGEVIRLATSEPARAIGRPELGTLQVGSPADLAVCRITDEPVALWDTHLECRRWDRRLRVEAVYREGREIDLTRLIVESPEVINRRCRLRGPDAFTHSWQAALEKAGLGEDGSTCTL